MHKCVMISMTEELHEKFREYCKAKKLKLSTKIQELITKEMSEAEFEPISDSSESPQHTEGVSQVVE